MPHLGRRRHYVMVPPQGEGSSGQADRHHLPHSDSQFLYGKTDITMLTIVMLVKSSISQTSTE